MCNGSAKIALRIDKSAIFALKYMWRCKNERIKRTEN